MLSYVVLLGILLLSFVWSAPAGDTPTPGPEDIVVGSTEWVSVFSAGGNVLEHFSDSCPQVDWSPPAMECAWDVAGDAVVLICVPEGTGNGRFAEAQFAASD